MNLTCHEFYMIIYVCFCWGMIITQHNKSIKTKNLISILHMNYVLRNISNQTIITRVDRMIFFTLLVLISSNFSWMIKTILLLSLLGLISSYFSWMIKIILLLCLGWERANQTMIKQQDLSLLFFSGQNHTPWERMEITKSLRET